MRGVGALLLVAGIAVSWGCGASPSSSPTTSPGTRLVTAGQLLSWTQQANSVEVGQLRYVAYVDDARVPLTDVTCGTTADPNAYDCSAPVPAMTAGSHSLQIAAYFVGSEGMESARSPSPPLSIVFAGTAGSATAKRVEKTR
jgi:hypothetical protein